MLGVTNVLPGENSLKFAAAESAGRAALHLRGLPVTAVVVRRQSAFSFIVHPVHTCRPLFFGEVLTT